MSINLPYIDSASKKLWCILRFHKIRSNFYTESTLCKLSDKPKNRVATKDNNIVYKIDCTICEQSTFVNLNVQQTGDLMNPKNLSKIVIMKRIKLQNTVGKRITALSEIKRKLLTGKPG